MSHANNNQQQDNKNIVAFPDYGELAKQNANSSIIEHFIAFLFAKNTKLNIKTLGLLFRNLATILFIKTLLENSKTYLDNFKFTNVDYLKYQYQYLKYSENKYEISQSSISKKWTYDNKNISIDTLTAFLEAKSIYVSAPNTYYYSVNSFLIKVVTSNNKIIFCCPDIVAITRHVEDILENHKEFLLGNKTNMLKVTLNSVTDVIQLIPVGLTYSYETDNYKTLYESLVTNSVVDSALNMRQAPQCINFNGKPGTGKTTFGSYIANKAVFDRIILYNLVQSNKLDFGTLVANLERTIGNQGPKEKKPDGEQECVLLVFDEVDKWLDSHIDLKIDQYRNEARKKTETVNPNNEKTLETYSKLTVEEETDKRKRIRDDFLDKLYTLVDGQFLKNDRKYVIIFNTNDFDSLFENAGPKYEALKDRFQQYKFKRSKKNDIINITNDIRLTLKNKNKGETFTPLMNNIINFDEKLYENIPNNIKITCRSLFKVLTDNCFNIPKSIEHLVKNYSKLDTMVLDSVTTTVTENNDMLMVTKEDNNLPSIYKDDDI
jgi:hypothetical protein